MKVRVDGGVAAEARNLWEHLGVGDEVLGWWSRQWQEDNGRSDQPWVWPTKGQGDLGEAVSVAEWA